MILSNDTVDETPEVKVEAPDEEVVYTVREHKIDRFTTTRSIVPVGPVTCLVCGYDPVVTNKAKFMAESYAELDDEGKMVARNVFKKHMENHGAGQIAAAEVRNKELKA